MPNPGKFHGKRKSFLVDKRPQFDASVDNGTMGEVLLQILRAYFRRFPVDMADDIEPTDEELAVVDDDAPEENETEAGLDSMNNDEYDAEMVRLKERQDKLEAKKGQIKRWFIYRYMRDQNFDPRASDPSNPYNQLLHQLTSQNNVKKPRLKVPVNLWCKSPENSSLIQAEFDKSADAFEPKRRAAKRAEIAQQLFKALPEEERDMWHKKANDEHKAAMAEYEAALRGSVSKLPEDRQRCINGVVQFIQPILDKVAEATGFQGTLMLGGPEPVRGGQLNVISIHSGNNGGTIPLNFGQKDRDGFMGVILPRFGAYLKGCYTPEECLRRALPNVNVQDSLESTAMEEGASFHSFGFPDGSPAPAPTIQPRANKPTTTNSTSTASAGATAPACSTHASTAAPQAGVTHLTPESSPSEPPIPSASNAGVDDEDTSTSRLLESVNRSLAEDIEGEDSIMRSPQAPSHGGSLVPTPSYSPQVSPRRQSPTSVEDTASHTSVGHKRPADSDLELPPMKRHNPPADILPDNAPAWIVSAVKFLRSGCANPKWSELVAAWLVYEGRQDFRSQGKLSPKGRPKVISEWIKWARKDTWRPSNFPPVSVFEREYSAWWAGLQPSWRRHADGSLNTAGIGHEWAGLHVFGINGLLSVLACLLFWGLEVERIGGDADAWDNAVKDCVHVIRSMSSI